MKEEKEREGGKEEAAERWCVCSPSNHSILGVVRLCGLEQGLDRQQDGPQRHGSCPEKMIGMIGMYVYIICV